MLAHVREPLLHDPEDLDLLVGREREAGIDLQLHVELAVCGEDVDVAPESRVEGALPLADERARIANRASCCARAAAALICVTLPSGAFPASSMLACVEIVKRYWASPSWISRATRARSSATARPNSAKRIARHTPAIRTP